MVPSDLAQHFLQEILVMVSSDLAQHFLQGILVGFVRPICCPVPADSGKKKINSTRNGSQEYD